MLNLQEIIANAFFLSDVDIEKTRDALSILNHLLKTQGVSRKKDLYTSLFIESMYGEIDLVDALIAVYKTTPQQSEAKATLEAIFETFADMFPKESRYEKEFGEGIDEITPVEQTNVQGKHDNISTLVGMKFVIDSYQTDALESNPAIPCALWGAEVTLVGFLNRYAVITDRLAEYHTVKPGLYFTIGAAVVKDRRGSIMTIGPENLYFSNDSELSRSDKMTIRGEYERAARDWGIVVEVEPTPHNYYDVVLVNIGQRNNLPFDYGNNHEAEVGQIIDIIPDVKAPSKYLFKINFFDGRTGLYHPQDIISPYFEKGVTFKTQSRFYTETPESIFSNHKRFRFLGGFHLYP